MNPENLLAGTASLFMALGDKTRLRLLNLMRDREICVSSFTGTLGHSQPLISRHLAYLRNSGLVEARRDGKWIHYSLATGLDPNTSRLLGELFKWMESQEGLRIDRENYQEAYPSHHSPAPMRSSAQPRVARVSNRIQPQARPEPVEEIHIHNEKSYESDHTYEQVSHHNEIEDFLLLLADSLAVEYGQWRQPLAQQNPLSSRYFLVRTINPFSK